MHHLAHGECVITQNRLHIPSAHNPSPINFDSRGTLETKVTSPA